jgi:hypothetical protein
MELFYDNYFLSYLRNICVFKPIPIQPKYVQTRVPTYGMFVLYLNIKYIIYIQIKDNI